MLASATNGSKTKFENNANQIFAVMPGVTRST